jgi:hypothetical protein
MKNIKSKLTTITQDSEVIILLNGLARTSRSMNKAGKLLTAIKSSMMTTLREKITLRL